MSKNKFANNFYIQKRGPDHTNTVKVGDYYFTHNLLHVTGQFTPQPMITGDIICLYNGELYNTAFERSDGDVLIPLYQTHGVDFVRELDGEFAIALYDFAQQIALFCTDPFGTKPLWENGTEAASYRSGVGGTRVPPNSRVIVDLRTGKREETTVLPFDFKHQHKDTYDDWMAAFAMAVQKRAKEGCFIALSSGYDSGAIDCVLTQLGVSYKAFSIEGEENLEILRARNKRGAILRATPELIEQIAEDIRTNTETYTYELTVNGKRTTQCMFGDEATIGLAWIYMLARQEGRKVTLSGQGADEILSDYALWPGVSELNGHFPEELNMWHNFAGNLQTAYLTKEEYIAGTYGIETRYPFLDKAVVQEFLWMSADLKNRSYKAPLHHLLTRNTYPFEANRKRGFSLG